MNYKKIYDSLILKARSENRSKSNTLYYESHHIIPTALGGPDTTENKVLLTAREHFIAHWLLYKMCKGIEKSKMAHAWNNMCIGSKLQSDRLINLTAKKYEFARKAHAKAVSDELKGKSYLELYGEEKTNELLEKRRLAKLGNKHSKETREKIAAAKRGKPSWNKGKQFNEESRKKMSESRKGDSRSDKSYKIIDPSGKEYIVERKGLPWFWNNVLNEKFPSSFKKVSTYKEGINGKWKGWKVYVLPQSK